MVFVGSRDATPRWKSQFHLYSNYIQFDIEGAPNTPTLYLINSTLSYRSLDLTRWKILHNLQCFFERIYILSLNSNTSREVSRQYRRAFQ